MVPEAPLLDRIAETVARHGMFPHGARVGVAVSGGADSVCLLHALVELAPRWSLSLAVLHVDHGLRAAESRADAAFVADLACRLNLPFHLATLDLRATAGNLEEAARRARLAFFRRFLLSGELDRVALGHTRADQAETVLFRFLRGSGTAGLAGIRPVTTGGIVRPLLDIDRPEIRAWLRLRGIAWREDSSNASREFARNRIRHDLLPQLAREWNPALVATLAQTARWALDEESYWRGEIARLAPRHLRLNRGAVLFQTGPLLALPAAVARRLLRCALARVKGDLRAVSFAHVSAILDLAASASGHGRLQVPGVDVTRSFDWMRLAPPAAAPVSGFRIPLPVPGSAELGGGALLHAEIIETERQNVPASSVYNEEMGFLDRRRIAGPLEVRNWRPGDQYQPHGRCTAERIKLLFQQARVPLWERRFWPVVTERRNIVWVGRFGPAAAYAAGPESRELLAIRYLPAADESWNRDGEG